MSSLALDADLGIENAAGLKQALAARLANKRVVAIDGAAVQRVHSASLQLLAAFWRTRAGHGRKTRLDAASPPLAEALRLLALDTALGLDLPETPDE